MEFGYGLLTAQRPESRSTSYEAVYDETIGAARAAEEHGFDAVWTSEHHFFDDGYLPSIFPLCAALARETDTIDIGTGIALAPLHHPLRLAENAATVDVLSGGRFRLGLANGYIRREFDTLGVPLRERAPRTEDAIAVCRRAWTEPTVTYDGHRFECEAVAVEPKPVQDGGPPILLGGMSEPAVDRAADVADGHIGVIYYPDGWSDRFTYENFERNVERIESRRADDEPFTVAALQYGHVADTDESAWDEIRPHVVYSRRKYAEHMADGDPSQWNEDALDDDRLAALRDGSLVGAPDTVVGRLERLDRATPGELHVIVRMWHPNLELDEHVENIRRFSDEVLARF